MTDRGDWIQTYSGRAFYPLDPRPEDVCMRDIAHALSHLCRFGGHSTRFYSVAEHSSTLCEYFLLRGDRELARWALLHDAAEAYLVDVPRPIKSSLTNYRAIERRIMEAICTRFALPWEEPAAVREADLRILTDESRALMAPAPMRWATETEPLGVHIVGVRPDVARATFSRHALQLFDRMAA
ncbi:phosphohydrolase [Methylocystis parvus]|uniref:phosphohydrolase n=1 Tax=Methylocystis parvus TaxID=134 RepID=UPI003C7687E7